jgi:heat shock protein HtpX
MAFRNTAKTVALLAGIGGLLVLVGSALGGAGGALIGAILGLVVVGASYWFSDKIAVRAAGAHEVSEQEAPQLHAMVADLAATAGLPKPRVYVSPAAQPNAFATGRNPRHSAVAVTEGLLTQCPPDELRAVLAHEMAHIRNRDILIGSVAAAIATGISFVANMALWAGMFGGGDDEDGPSPIVAILLAILAPLAATVLQMALSRSREFEADRVGAQLLGDPEPLARALRRIDTMAARTPLEVSPAQASAYIVNPLTGRQVNFARLFLTHPPVEERIERLQAMRQDGTLRAA